MANHARTRVRIGPARAPKPTVAARAGVGLGPADMPAGRIANSHPMPAA